MDSVKPGRRRWIRIISYLTAAFLILIGLIICKQRETMRVQRYLALSQMRAFHQLSDAVGELDIALEKASYAASPSMISNLCTEIYGRAEAAQMSLGELPYANLELEQTAAFVARVGDYAYAVSRSAAKEGGWTEEQLETWSGLSRQAAQLSEQLAALEADVQAGSVTLESVDSAERRMAAMESGSSLSAGTMYEEIEEGYDQLPTLIYDGPFSQHLDGQSPAALEGLEPVTQETALSNAARFLGVSGGLSVTSRLEGSIPGWLIEGTVSEAPVSLEVSEAGGVVIQYTRPCQIRNQMIPYQEGVALAKSFLEKQGYSNLTERYYQEDSGVLTVNFAYQQEDTICYPDLIKVSVALDTGAVTGFEAKGYLTQHRQRDIPAPALSPAEAAGRVPDRVEVLSTQYTVIPTEGGYELACWEVKCEGESGRHVIYYLNGETGAEEKIFLLQESETGTLVL